jgi:hypothetical protein
MKKLKVIFVVLSTAALIMFAAQAVPTPRGNTTRPPVTNTRATISRGPVTPSVVQEAQDTAAAVEQVEEAIETSGVEDMSAVLRAKFGGGNAEDSSDSAIAKMMREHKKNEAQRQQIETAQQRVNRAEAPASCDPKDSCDSRMRACVKKKCGERFQDCYADNETVWNMKVEPCAEDAGCNAAERAAALRELTADRQAEMKYGSFFEMQDCAEKYNKCIVQTCGGSNWTNCLSRNDSAKAILGCQPVADECRNIDSGLAARADKMLSTLRVAKEEEVARNEKRLREVIDLMTKECEEQGGTIDTRSYTCTYSVKLWVAELNDKEPMAIMTLHAGSPFQCTEQFFQTDLTTFKEDAIRLTRAQEGMGNMLLGAGGGLLAGNIASGGMGRMITAAKTKAAAKKAEKGERCAEDDTRSECQSTLKKIGGGIGGLFGKKKTKEEKEDPISTETSSSNMSNSTEDTNTNSSGAENIDNSSESAGGGQGQNPADETSTPANTDPKSSESSETSVTDAKSKISSISNSTSSKLTDIDRQLN